MEVNYFTILYWFCHTSTWIRHGCTRVPHPEPPSHLPPLTIPLGHSSAPAPGIHASNLDWRFVSYMILYMFPFHSSKSSHPLPLPQCLKDCSIHLCLFCCLAFMSNYDVCSFSFGAFKSPLDCEEIQPVHPKGNQSLIFVGRTDAKAETPILWPPDAKN